MAAVIGLLVVGIVTVLYCAAVLASEADDRGDRMN